MNDQTAPTPLPAPPVPAELDVSTFGWMPFYGDKLLSSNFNSKTNDLEWRIAVTLWWAAWKQIPAGSLPNDDDVMCRLAGLGKDLKTWRKAKAGALYGFYLCSDGRLYHRVVSQLALDAFDRKKESVARTEAATAARRARASSRQSGLDLDTGDVTRTSTFSTVNRTGTDKGREPFVLPPWVPVDAWEGFVDMRRRIKKPLTDYAKKLAVRDLESLAKQGEDVRKCLDQSTFKSWQGLFPYRDDTAPPVARAGVRGGSVEDANRAAAEVAVSRRRT